jgi:hypothetical protein
VKSNERELGMIKACLHNADACLQVGEDQKGEVWEILCMCQYSSERNWCSFDGWGGAGRDALNAR